MENYSFLAYKTTISVQQKSKVFNSRFMSFSNYLMHCIGVAISIEQFWF